MKTILTACFFLVLFAAPATSQETVFSHDFEIEPPGDAIDGDLADIGMLGTPSAGTVSASGGFVSVNRPAYTTGNNGASNGITAIDDGSFNDVGAPAGNFLTVNLDSAAAVTGALGAGQTYGHIRGLSATGLEVFQILWRSGSGAGTRELYARENGEDNTTFAAGVFASVDGTLVLDDVAFNINSVFSNSAPTNLLGVSITIDENGWNVTGTPDGGASVSTPATGLSIGSGATDLSSIVFFTSHNVVIDNENKGLWVDNVVVTTDLTVEVDESIGDFNGDGVVDCADLEGYVGNLGAAATGPLAALDIDLDGTLAMADAELLVGSLIVTSNGVLGTALGDLNCDGEVNVLGDAFALIGGLGNAAATYSQGDINFDETVTVLGDAFVLIGALGFTNAP